jgi:phosphohistidine phosphatase SixA
LLVTVAVTPRANDFRLLQKGGYVLMFRHAAADVGSDQTGSVVKDWWKSCDSQLARQLNAQGKLDAVNTGKTLRALQIPVKRVLSSEYCRCFTSADLMALGVPTQQLKEITYFVYDEANRYTNSLTLAASQPMDGSNTVVVGHAGFSGSLPATPVLNSLNWGDAAIFQIVSGQPAKYISTLAVKDFTDLAK